MAMAARIWTRVTRSSAGTPIFLCAHLDTVPPVGRIEPVVDEEGFDPAWLRETVLEVRPRGGGERFKPHPARPSKTLKRLFQDAGIPEFERGRLPLVWRKGELIYVAGLGADAVGRAAAARAGCDRVYR